MAPRHHRHEHHDVGSSGADQRLLVIALSLIASFVVIEVTAAIMSSSLALLADAGHMMTDVIALGTSVVALRLAHRPATRRFSYGLKRAEIMSAAVNGVFLAATAVLVATEAVQRLISPRVVDAKVVLVVAVVGAGINVAASAVLGKADQGSLNIRAAYLHVVTDLYAFLATAAASVVILATSWYQADAIASLFVVALMGVASWGLLRDAGRILLQASPEELDVDEVRNHLLEVDHVLGVHDLHAWTVTSGQVTIAAHVVVESHCFESGHAPQILDQLQHCLEEHFDVRHATFQLEPTSHVAHEGETHA